MKSAIQSFNNLSIQTKLPLVALLLVFPVTLFVYFLLTEKNDLINFTKKEIAGLHYLRAAHQVLDVATSPTPTSDAYNAAADALTKAEQDDAGTLGVTDKANAIISALHTAAQGKDGGDITDKTTDLISALSDNSNITLDPDNDAYFVGDLIVNQATGVLTQVSALLSAAQALDKQASDDNKIAYAEARDNMITSAGNLATDASKAIKGNADGTLKLSIGPGAADIADAVTKLTDASKTTDRAALAAAAADLASKTQAYVTQNNSEMERLLNTRITGFYVVIFTRLGIALGVLVLGGLVFLSVVRSISSPLAKLIVLTGRLADGETDVKVPRSERADEIGKLARCLSVFHGNILEKQRFEREAKEAELKAAAKAEEEKKQMMRKLAEDFQGGIHDIIAAVAAASTELYQTAEVMQKSVSNVGERSGTAANASEQTNANVQGVSAAVEQMSASVKEIATQITKSSDLVTDTMSKAQLADKNSQVLAEAVSQISGILRTVRDIAGRINLLALNATIESARAGEMGKGFAVVAAEVKKLATQTTKATEEIAVLITNVQHASKEVVDVLGTIQGSIVNVNQFSSSVAAAVEQQSAATNEISTNMQRASQSVQSITTNITHIATSASDAGQAAGEVLSASQMLSQQSELLNVQVKAFLDKIAA